MNISKNAKIVCEIVKLIGAIKTKRTISGSQQTTTSSSSSSLNEAILKRCIYVY